MTAAEAVAIDTEEAARLLAPLAHFPHVALAVSGGADSTALLLLAARWRATRLSVLTVDHGLRPAAAEEAAAVAAWARALGLEAHVLRWEGAKPASGIQAAARQARYRLLRDWCRRHDAALATAHTADDQAETVLMRLARGSGVDGLSGIAAEAAADGCPILRPLLAVPHARLVATLEAAGHRWFEDPSNENRAFERVRLRQAMPALAAAGLAPPALSLAARRLARAREALEAATDTLATQALTLHHTGHAEVAMPAFAATPAELRIRLLSRLLQACGGGDAPPNLASVEDLDRWLASGSGRARTLAGCRIVRRRAVLVVGREPGRLASAPHTIAAGSNSPQLWDNRFRICVTGTGGPVVITALREASRRCRAHALERPRGLPAFVWETLPAAIVGEDAVAVPPLGLRSADFPSSPVVEAVFAGFARPAAHFA